MTSVEDFLKLVKDSVSDHTFSKLTISKNRDKKDDLLNVYVRSVEIKGEERMSFTYRHRTSDQTKNLMIDEAISKVKELLENQFKSANLITDTKVHSLMISKKGKISIHSASQKIERKEEQGHDRQKKKFISRDAQFLQVLGITDEERKIIPKMADKYRQINKYIEIIDGLIAQTKLPNRKISVVDMGAGKGYLTFALYDYLVNQKEIEAQVVGIELRKELVDFCNEASASCGFSGLQFIDSRIENYEKERIDILIALHACDTATDDAIGKGLKDKAELIICAPCCHKEVRQQLKGAEQNDPILKYGIFKERQYEMVTDTLRALILEKEGYESKVFEFVSNEHTRKNVMLVGLNKHSPQPKTQDKIDAIKTQYGIQSQRLEELMSD